MSYQFNRPMLPSLLGGLGSLAPTSTGDQKAYYIALIETYNTDTRARQYAWSQYRYLSFWDANAWSFSFLRALPSSRQAAIMYQWTGSTWAKVIDDTTVM